MSKVVELPLCPFCGDVASYDGAAGFVNCRNSDCALFYVDTPRAEWVSRPVEDRLRSDRVADKTRIAELETENEMLRDQVIRLSGSCQNKGYRIGEYPRVPVTASQVTEKQN